VAHSFGGLVVKKALLIAAKSQKYLQILRDTSGIIFFATPQSANPRDIQKVLDFSAGVSSVPLNDDMVTSFKDIRKLTWIHAEFEKLLWSSRLRVVSFFEEIPTSTLGLVCQNLNVFLI
jgi:hypothetical protein